MGDANELRRILSRIDGRGYKAYRDLRGAFDLGSSTLYVDRVQADPFAAPTRIRVRIPAERASLPPSSLENRVRRLALADFLARRVRDATDQLGDRKRGSASSGLVRVDAGGQQVLERSAVAIADDWVEVRLEVGLPAAGRRVLGRQAEALLCGDVARVAERGLCAAHGPEGALREFVACVENQEDLRAQLDRLGLLAFVANGAVLPRESGRSDRPLRGDAVIPFAAPRSLEVELSLTHPMPGPEGPRRTLTGLGIPKGVTLIVGGGYHGKSTLLRALERAVYPHIPGDGREWVVSRPDLVKIRAEDGRRVACVDISGFISALPGGRRTDVFSSDDASGSTSQAANIVEAVEAGARGLLLDEDTSATNFMVRDARMQALIAKQHEPITPFLDRVRELYERQGVSSVLVMGGCGDYFDVADTVILMREYRPHDATREARSIARAQPSARRAELRDPLPVSPARIPRPDSIDASRGRREVKIDAKHIDLIVYGTEPIDLRCVEQLVDPSQTRAIGFAIHLAAERFMQADASLAEILEALEAFLDARGLDALEPFHRPELHPGNLARPRRFEIAAALNRLRTLEMRVLSEGASDGLGRRDRTG
ncbi:MAG: ABC-ATPase domain-containing protein [Myxococcales bacterium]|nr:ABC-ATPase domain-containing protein [Myxococcales bacterium]MDH5305648.1 ABC-ATPase domain-containing protein [Myxococcales bacterium]